MLDKKFQSEENKKEIANLIGRLVSFNNSLKLYHWHVTGEGSYATHIALDQALDSLNDAVDSLSETSYALLGDLEIVIPKSKRPDSIVDFVKDEFLAIRASRALYPDGFEQGVLDVFQQTLQQLLYRLRRLK